MWTSLLKYLHVILVYCEDELVLYIFLPEMFALIFVCKVYLLQQILAIYIVSNMLFHVINMNNQR